MLIIFTHHKIRLLITDSKFEEWTVSVSITCHVTICHSPVSPLRLLATAITISIFHFISYHLRGQSNCLSPLRLLHIRTLRLQHRMLTHSIGRRPFKPVTQIPFAVKPWLECWISQEIESRGRDAEHTKEDDKTGRIPDLSDFLHNYLTIFLLGVVNIPDV